MEEIYNMKKDEHDKLKKQSKKNDKKRQKFMKRIASENHLRGQLVKNQEQYARLKKESE